MILGYQRISSVKQQDGNSLEYQTQKIKEYCSLKELPLTEVFSEVDSGGNDERIILKKVKQLISLGQVQCIVVWKLDRLSRSMLGGLQFIQFCKEHNTRVVCISDNLDSGNESSELMINILLSIAQEERRQIKTRCNMGRNMIWKNNQIPYPKIPFGYTRQKDTLTLNEDSKVVEYIFRKYNVLTKMKHITKRQRTERLIKLLERNGYTFNGKKFRWWNIRDILSQTLYSGIITWKGESKESLYPTIVSKRLFNQIQTTLEK
tara:strand:- start:719 stop:1504 length:786 start_codon:yes stop_codon:yes gene_type:complete